MSPAMDDSTVHHREGVRMDSIGRKSSMDSLSSANTSIHSSRCSSVDHTRDTSSFTQPASHRSSSPPPTPIHTSRSSRFRVSPLSPRSFRSARSSRQTTAPLKLHGLPKTPGISSPQDGGRGGNLSPDTQSPPFSPRSFRSIFSGANAQSPSAGSEFSTTTTILSVPETNTAATSPAEGKRTPASTIGNQVGPGQTVAPVLFNRSIPRSRNQVVDVPPPPTPSMFEPKSGVETEKPSSNHAQIRANNRENAGPLSKLASKFKGMLGNSGANEARPKRNKSGEPHTAKAEQIHWTEL